MSSQDWTDWQAYDQTDPLGPGMDRYLMALHIAVTLNRYRDPRKSKEVTPAQVLDVARAAVLAGPPREPTPEEQAMAQKAMLRALGDAAQRQQAKRRTVPGSRAAVVRPIARPRVERPRLVGPRPDGVRTRTPRTS